MSRLTGLYTAYFVSLGFAWAGHAIHVTVSILGGYETALERALLSVPGHGLFGVRMGYYFALGNTAIGKDICRLPFSVLILPMHCIIIFC